MPTAPLQVSHLSGLQPPLSQTCHNQQPTDADAADQPNHWLPALRLIQVTITFLLAVRPCVTFGNIVSRVSLVSLVSIVSHVSLMSHFAFHVSDVSHIITWCHTLQTVSATRCHVPPDSHSNLSRLCHTWVTLVLCHNGSHWLATLSHIGLPCFTSGWSVRSLSCGSNLSRVLVTILILLVESRSFWSNFDDKPTAQVISIARWNSN